MEERSSSNSFSRQASQASWIIPFVNLGVMAAGNSAIRSAGPSPIGTLILGCTAILFFIAGIILGIVGLFGIKKNGAKSTLVPSVVGILLNGVLLSLLLAVVISSFHKARAVGGLP